MSLFESRSNFSPKLPPKLSNPSAVCYLNSGLQALLSCSIFIKDMETLENVYFSPKKLKLFNKMIHSLESSNKSIIVSENELFNEWCKPGQQDAFELLSYIINQIYDEIRKSNEELVSDFRKWLDLKLPLRVKISSNMVCLCKESIKTPLEVNLGLHVPIFRINNRRDSLDLEELLDQYFSQSDVDDFNCDHSVASNEKNIKATKHSLLVPPIPKTLMFHLQRSEWNGWIMSKVRTKVKFPVNTILKLKSEWLDKTVGEHHQVSKEESEYELCAVVEHLGHSELGGHYMCYRRFYNADDDRFDWFLTNDNYSSKVNASQVENSEAYILLYENKAAIEKLMRDMKIKDEFSYKNNRINPMFSSLPLNSSGNEDIYERRLGSVRNRSETLFRETKDKKYTGVLSSNPDKSYRNRAELDIKSKSKIEDNKSVHDSLPKNTFGNSFSVEFEKTAKSRSNEIDVSKMKRPRSGSSSRLNGNLNDGIAKKSTNSVFYDPNSTFRNSSSVELEKTANSLNNGIIENETDPSKIRQPRSNSVSSHNDNFHSMNIDEMKNTSKKNNCYKSSEQQTDSPTIKQSLNPAQLDKNKFNKNNKETYESSENKRKLIKDIMLTLVKCNIEVFNKKHSNPKIQSFINCLTILKDDQKIIDELDLEMFLDDCENIWCFIGKYLYGIYGDNSVKNMNDYSFIKYPINEHDMFELMKLKNEGDIECSINDLNINEKAEILIILKVFRDKFPDKVNYKNGLHRFKLVHRIYDEITENTILFYTNRDEYRGAVRNSYGCECGVRVRHTSICAYDGSMRNINQGEFGGSMNNINGGLRNSNRNEYCVGVRNSYESKHGRGFQNLNQGGSLRNERSEEFSKFRNNERCDILHDIQQNRKIESTDENIAFLLLCFTNKFYATLRNDQKKVIDDMKLFRYNIKLIPRWETLSLVSFRKAYERIVEKNFKYEDYEISIDTVKYETQRRLNNSKIYSEQIQKFYTESVSVLSLSNSHIYLNKIWNNFFDNQLTNCVITSFPELLCISVGSNSAAFVKINDYYLYFSKHLVSYELKAIYDRDNTIHYNFLLTLPFLQCPLILIYEKNVCRKKYF